MNLSKKLAEDFSTTARNRGKNYYAQGRVNIRHASHSQVDALVRGSQNYEVSLDWEDGVLFASCDCPHFESDGPCKHLWAAILAAEARGYLSAAASADVILECVDIEDEDDDWANACAEIAKASAAIANPLPIHRNSARKRPKKVG